MCSLLSILVFLQRWLVSLVLRRTRHAGASCARRGRGPGAGTGQEACPTWSYRWMPGKMSTISWARPFTTSPMALPAAAASPATGQAFHHFAYGLARGRRIAGYVLPSGRAEEHEEIAGRECGGAGGIGWNCHDE